MKNQDIKRQVFQNLERGKYITSSAQPEMFKDRGGLVGLGHFYKYLVRNTRKKRSAGKNVGVFSPRYPQKWTLSGHFLQNQGTFFPIFKIVQRIPPPPSPTSCAPILVALVKHTLSKLCSHCNR